MTSNIRILMTAPVGVCPSYWRSGKSPLRLPGTSDPLKLTLLCIGLSPQPVFSSMHPTETPGFRERWLLTTPQQHLWLLRCEHFLYVRLTVTSSFLVDWQLAGYWHWETRSTSSDEGFCGSHWRNHWHYCCHRYVLLCTSCPPTLRCRGFPLLETVQWRFRFPEVKEKWPRKPELQARDSRPCFISELFT